MVRFACEFACTAKEQMGLREHIDLFQLFLVHK